MNDTYIPTLIRKNRDWFLIDCKDQQLGRLASSIVQILSGKVKPYYYPSSDVGDYVILINVESLIINSKDQKFNVFCPGRPGHALKKRVNAMPKQIVENCIKSMMANNKLRNQLHNRLKVYSGSLHPHKAQSPIKLDPTQLLKNDV